jgi:hypothetical protein
VKSGMPFGPIVVLFGVALALQPHFASANTCPVDIAGNIMEPEMLMPSGARVDSRGTDGEVLFQSGC